MAVEGVQDAVAVTTGFTWTAAGAWATFLTLLAVIIRQVGPWRQITVQSEQKFREELIERVNKLEKTLEKERAINNAERRIDGHRLANVTQCLDALLMMLEAAPDKAVEIVGRIKAMRAEQIKAEALEKATLQVEIVKYAGEDVKLGGG